MKTVARKITLVTELAYGGVNLIGSGALAISGAWLLYFYTTFCNLSVVEATLIFSIATYLDVLLNPVMGFITDNFYETKLGRKFGRRRFFILIAIPLMLLYPLLWVSGNHFFYYLTTYIAFEITYTMVMIPYETLAVEMTDDFDQRTKLTGYKAMFGKVANFLAAAIPGLFFALYPGGEDSSTPFLLTGITYCVIMMSSLVFFYFNSWERRPEQVQREVTAGLLQSLRKLFVDIFSTLRIKAFRNHLGMYLFGFGAEWLFTSVFTYYIVFALGHQKTFVAQLNSLSSILQLVSTAVFMAICIKMGFRKPYMYALTIVIAAVVGYVSLYVFDLGSMSFLIVGITVLFGLGTGGVYYIPWTVYTFMADIDEAVTLRRREGIYAGAMTMAGKCLRATVVFIMGLVLSFAGFEKGADVQPESAVNALALVMGVGVCGMALVGVFFASRMKLSHQTHTILIDEVKRVKEGGSMDDATPEARKVIEELTGFKYEDCFGHNKVGYQMEKLDIGEPVS